jgi:hypothetical protein
MPQRGRRSSKGGGGLPLALILVVGGPLLLFGAFSGPTKPRLDPPTSYASLQPGPAPVGLAQAPVEARDRPSPQPVVEPPVSPAAAKPPATETLFVSGRKVALRAEPSAQGKVVDRYGSGQPVEVLERSEEWIRVRHRPTQREGWIQSKRLRAEPLVQEAKEQPKPATVAPKLSSAEIAKILIADSIAAYSGPCACPYQSARNGSSCGRRAAYVRPGGYSPLCYAKDVTPEMVAEYRASH